MGSTDRDVRDRQLAKAQAKYAARKAKLEGAGLDAKAQGKDALLRALAADLRKAKGRIESIESAARHVAETAAKDVRLKKEEADKAKAKGKAKAAEGGGKPKKEKAEKAKPAE